MNPSIPASDPINAYPIKENNYWGHDNCLPAFGGGGAVTELKGLTYSSKHLKAVQKQLGAGSSLKREPI